MTKKGERREWRREWLRIVRSELCHSYAVITGGGASLHLGFGPLVEDGHGDVGVGSPEERRGGEVAGTNGTHTQGTHGLSGTG